MAGGYLRFDVPYLKQIPIPNINNILIKLTDFLLFKAKDKIVDNIIDNVVDAAVFNLYFPDHMKERGIDVLDFVERDINEVMQQYPSAVGISPKVEKFWKFEQLSDSKKEQVIEQLHQKWTDPDNEVVKRMAMFKEKSPEILKPILDS
jgi:hypothetical protein